MSERTAIVDGHVHLHDCYDVDQFFDIAFANLDRAAKEPASAVRFLLFSECAGDDFFGAMAAGKAVRGASLKASEWLTEPTGETESLRARSGAKTLYLVSGRQIACAEGLEVLILGTRQTFKDRRPIADVLQEAAALGRPHVIPWGAGKWFFKRGKLLSHILQTHQSPLFFLGDEGGRPKFWRYPRHFREARALGVQDLPGTDPLPFAHDVVKVGRVGFRVKINFDESRPFASLLATLSKPGVELDRFAKFEPPGRFLQNQVAMQLRKRPA